MSSANGKVMKKQRKRLNPVYRWTHAQTNEFLEIVVKFVKNDPTSFERPSARAFYEDVLTRGKHLQVFTWKNAKNKVRNMKTLYLSACTWKTYTGADLIASGQEKRVEDHIERVCPHFNLLEQIFGQPTNLKETLSPPIVIKEEDESSGMDFMAYESTCSNEEHEEPCGSSTPDPIAAEENDERSSITLLFALQEKKLELEVKRFELEKEKATNQMEIEKEKAVKELEFKKLQMDQEFELRKLEIERDERIQKYELELKYKRGFT